MYIENNVYTRIYIKVERSVFENENEKESEVEKQNEER